MAALGKALDCGVDFLEVANLSDTERLADFEPDIIIANPIVLGYYNLKHSKQKLFNKALYVALVSTPTAPDVLNGYNGVINLHDSPDDMHNTIDRLMGYADGDENDGLSEREKDIIKGVVRGLPNKSIADELNLSVHTIITHRRNIAKKLQIHSASALTIYAISNKLVDINEVSKNL